MHGDTGRFDEWAPSYERHWMQRFLFDPVQRTVLDLAAEQVPRPEAILDVGCGTGRLLRLAADRFPGARLEGVDAAPEMVRQAQAALPTPSRVNFQHATAESLPFSDATFDLVFSTLTFHHWSDQQKGIREVARVLAPGGRWVLADFVAGGIAAVVARAFRADRFPRRARLEAMLADGELAIVTQRPVGRTLGNVPALAIGARPDSGPRAERAMGIGGQYR